MSEQNAQDPWGNVSKRLASKARGLVRGGRGNFGIIRITILVDCNGSPIGWNNPVGEKLEPGGEWPVRLLKEPDKDKEAL